MSKWNKTKSTAPSEQFLQNQQRRRQLIIEAAKRRRQKQKKLQQLNLQIKRKEQQAILKHKQEKKQAYNRHFKASVPNANMHDKYQQIKRNQKINKVTDTEVSKWKRRGKSEDKVQHNQSNNTFQEQGNPLDKYYNAVTPPIQKKPKINEEKKKIIEQFQRQWNDDDDEKQQISEDLIGSKLLDSLDLDFDTIARGQKYDRQIQKKQPVYSLLTDQQKQKEVEEMKALIGYDSMLISVDQRDKKHIKSEITPQVDKKLKTMAKKNKKQMSQQETFNQLKNKKQGKLLGWTNLETVEEADDLFSHCSSNKAIKPVHIPERATQKNIRSRKVLEPIPERKLSANKSKQNNERPSSIDKKVNPNPQQRIRIQKQAKKITNIRQNENPNERQLKKNITKINQNNHTRSNSIDKQSQSRQKVQSRQRILSRQKPQIKQRNQSRENQRIQSRQKPQIQQRNQSKQKTKSQQRIQPLPKQNQKNPPKTQQYFNKAPTPPPRKQPSVQPIRNAPTSIATHEQFFDVESFIKNDLLNLNEQQSKLQQQIKQLHIESKGNITNIETKNEIRKDYRTADNLIKHMEDPNYQSQVYGYTNMNKPRNQEQLEDSIQKLDDLLIRREIDSVDIMEESSHSIINPFSKPEDFQKQILQLAENISRFQQQPEPQAPGYGKMQRMKKQKKQYIPEQITSQATYKNKNQQINSNKIDKPPSLHYSSKQNNHQNVDDIAEDSLETMQKIHVNDRLKNILFD